ncbi:MAG TPA: FCD domain-containing protein [Burkholderiales bacterium]|jgi:DNA-binding FadR family transcriptional regulator
MTQALQKFSRISSTPAYKLVAQAIERDILSGKLRDGEPLGTETELATQFGVNRSTVREGIRLLEHGGLIRRDSSRRLWIGLPGVEGLAERMTRALVLHEVTFRELYEASLALQIATVEAAAERATPEQIEQLEENVARTEEHLGDPAAVAKLDGEFHTLVGQASHNRVLQLAREPSELLVVSSTELVLGKVPEGAPRLLHAHRMYIDAIRRRDKQAARLWTVRHLNDWRRGFERAGRDLDSPIDRIYLQNG